MSRTSQTALCLAICCELASPAPVRAADFGQSSAAANLPATNEWSVSVTPYGWLTFLSGHSTVKGRTVDVDVDPIQVIEHLARVPAFSYIEARKGPVAFYTDIAYADLGLTGSGIRTINRGVTGTIGATLGLNFEQFIGEAGAIYEVARWDSSSSLKDSLASQSYTAVDVLAGARFWHQSLDLNFNLAGTLDVGGLVIAGGRAIAKSGSVDWVDPLMGVRLRRQFEPGKDMVLRADIGGFGAGSQFSWNVLGAFNYEIAKGSAYTVSAYLGYRALQADYVQGDGRSRYEFDIVQHGPVTGLTVKF